MTSNAKWGIKSPLPSETEEPDASGFGSPFWFEDRAERSYATPREHDPDAKALLNRHLTALQSGTRKSGNSALHDLESKLAALSDADNARTYSAPEPASDYPTFDQGNLNDRLRELSAYLNEDLSRIEANKASTVEPLPSTSYTSAPAEEEIDTPRTRYTHKSISAPILDREWFEDRFAAMRMSIDQIAEQVPDKRVEELGNQFHQLMEKLDAIQAGRSREAVESGLKQLANYLEENRNWTVAHDDRIKELEERLDHLGHLVSQSNKALSAAAKGLEIVARGTGPALVTKTADLVAERLESRLSKLATSDNVTQLTGEVSKLMLQSQHFARKTDDRLKLLQTSLDDSLNQMEDISNTVTVAKSSPEWNDDVDADTYQPPYAAKLSAAQRAAQLAAEHDEDFPEDGEPIRHQIPYGEFLPDEERGNSHLGLIVAAIILLLASAAMLYLNLKDSGAGRLLSNAVNTQLPVKSTPVKADAERPVRIVLTKAGGVQSTASTAPSITMRHTAPQAISLPAAVVTEIENGNERQAAILGDTAAQYSIAETYLREIRNETADASDERLSKAARWFRRAAEGGHSSAQYRLATLYELGHGVPQSYAEAMKWYERAAVGGHTKAMHNLGVLAASATTQKPDYQKAAYWFGKAAESGLRDSQYNLAILHENGLGVRKSMQGALRWYSAAALQGDTKAAEKRDEILRALPALGQTGHIAYPKAAKWTTVTASVVGGKANDPAPSAPAPKPQAVLKQATPKADRKNGGWNTQLMHINNAVLTAQELLLRLGFQPGKPDGIFGPRTMAAIRAYQEKAGLPKTGHVSDTLLSRMEAELSS